MKKNEVFTFTAPNGVEAVAVVVDYMSSTEEPILNGVLYTDSYLCYAQNRLFVYKKVTKQEVTEDGVIELVGYECGKVIADYAVLPEHDAILETA